MLKVVWLRKAKVWLKNRYKIVAKIYKADDILVKLRIM